MINAAVRQLRQPYWRLVLILWLASLLTVLPLALLPGSALLGLAARPAIATMSDGLDAWQWLDLLAVIQGSAGAGLPLPAALRQAVTGLGLAGVLLLPLGGLVSAFCYGGLLFSLKETLGASKLAAASPQEISASQPDIPDLAAGIPAAHTSPAWRFVQGGWRWLGAFSALAVLQFLVTSFVLIPLIIFSAALAAPLGPWGLLLAVPMSVLVVAVLGLFEQARVQCVLTDRRSPFTGLGSALHTLTHRPLAWLALYALNLLALFGLHVVFRLGILPAAAAFWPLALLAQQIFIIARLWLRVARLASSLELSAVTQKT